MFAEPFRYSKRPGCTYVSRIRFGHKTLKVRFFGRILTRICDLRSFGSWCIKGTDESLSRVDSSIPLMHHHPNDLRSQIRFRILPKKRTLSKMTTAISFSRQNDTGSLARTPCLLEKLVVVLARTGIKRCSESVEESSSKRINQTHYRCLPKFGQKGPI